jgi:superfamily II DNA or RNA helicase
MASQKKKLTFKNKNNEVETLVEQEDNHLELVINRYLDKKILLQDILIKQAQDDEDMNNKICIIYCKLVNERFKNSKNIEWFEREYQKNIIDNIIIKLFSLNKLYLELATGGGKSYIIYKIMSNIRPDTIIIFSPRKKINKQNISEKYLSLINNDYLVYNCSDNNSFNEFKLNCIRQNKKIIIVACPQSSNDKVYDIINDYNLSNIFIWFDEAHHTIENWVNKLDNKTIKFFLEDKTKITNRIYTSASPDKDHINKYLNIFGELYSPIKVKELIQLKWLCPIKCKILQYDIKDFDLVKWILDGFTEDSKNFGFSFHSRDNNAFNLFYKHYELFINSKTNIKPYLLINDSGLNDINKSKLKDIKLKLKYNFRDCKDFENTKKSMAYVVKQYDMGYDFKDLDYIVFTDPKISFQDIIQCIGRGVRPDGKGENGRNLTKQLKVGLPTYIIVEENNDYKNIIEVLRYIILDLEIDIESILINPIKNSDSEDLTNEEYKGDKHNSSILLDLLYSHNILEKVNTKSLIKFCKTYKVNNEQDYYRFKELNPSLSLKNNLYEYPGFYWKNIIDINNEIHYSTKIKCKQAKTALIKDFEKKLNEKEYDIFLENIEDKGWLELNKYDKKIPPYHDLDKYYPE